MSTMFEVLQERSGQHLLDPVEKIFRVDVSEDADRTYATLGALTDRNEVFTGVTTPSQQYGAGNTSLLVTWQKDQGIKKVIMGEVSGDADLETKEDMHFGSFFHGEIEEFVTNGLQYDKLHIKPAIESYFDTNQYAYSVTAWALRFERALRAFSMWIQEDGIQVLAVELPCVLREVMVDVPGFLTFDESKAVDILTFRVASCIDLVVRDKSGKLWIVDLKSGEKSYKGRQTYEQQLSFYEVMLKVNYPEFRDEEIGLANWSPKKFNARSRGWYHFDEQVRVPVWLLHTLCRTYWYYAEKNKFLDRTVTVFDDNVITPHGNGVQFITYYEFIQKKIQAYVDAQREHVDAHYEPGTEQERVANFVRSATSPDDAEIPF